MAARLRRVRHTGPWGWCWIALCAAEHPEEPGDVYIDDAQDHALRMKYLADYESEGLLNTSGRAIVKAEAIKE